MSNHIERTYSEDLFERYAAARGYGCERIEADGVGRIADYRLTICGEVLICEVSEVRPNEIDRLVIAGAGQYEMIGRRLQKKIVEKKAQLKRFAGKGIPLALVLLKLENIPCDYLSDEDMGAAMYGLPRYESAASTIPVGHGRKQLLGLGQSEYISAVCRLAHECDSGFRLSVFHNFYASVPIPRGLICAPTDRNLVKRTDPVHGPWEWSIQ